jgi:hypothetical protein
VKNEESGIRIMNNDKEERFLKLVRKGTTLIIEPGDDYPKQLTEEKARELIEEERQRQQVLEPILDCIKVLRQRLKKP